MKNIKTTKGLKSFVSDVDIQFVSEYKWHSDSRGYIRNNKLGSLHRVILERMLNSKIPKDMQVDHINRNPLDNRRENLRLATRGENQVNSNKKINYSGFRGVKKQEGRNKWTANIMKDSKRIYIGYFKTKEEAALAYNQKAKELFGDFAYLNIV